MSRSLPDSRWSAEEMEAIRAGAERASEDLPKRRPGTHWTGPSGEHAAVPVTPRTLVNLARAGRRIT